MREAPFGLVGAAHLYTCTRPNEGAGALRSCTGGAGPNRTTHRATHTHTERHGALPGCGQPHRVAHSPTDCAQDTLVSGVARSLCSSVRLCVALRGRP